MKRKVRKQTTRILSILMILALLFADITLALPGTRVYAETIDETEQITDENQLPEGEHTPVEESVEEEPLPESDPSQEDSSNESSSSDKIESSQEEQLENDTDEATSSVEEVEEDSQQYIEETEEEQTEDNSESENTVEEPTPNATEQENNEPIEVETDFNSIPALLITEIMPNNLGADQYEYVEVYNNSTQPIVLDHYSFFLRYTDGSGKADVEMKFAPATLQPGETKVFWYNHANHTVADFNEHYQTNLTEEDIVEYTGAPGFYNSGNRAVVVKDSKGNDVVWANYLKEDFTDGKVIEYTYPENGIAMETYETVANPTPGEVVAEQYPVEPVEQPENPAPQVTHEAVVEVGIGQDVVVEAVITDNADDITASLFVSTNQNEDFQKVVMNATEDGTYRAVIPNALLHSETYYYYVVVTDPNNRVVLPSTDAPYEVSVQLDEEDYDTYPHLLITELAPNSEGEGTDYYEFIELYNNTNQPLTLANYSFIYRYTDTGRDLPFQVPAITMEPQETIILWFNNGNRTLADFNANYQSNLTEEQVYEFTSVFPGFANGGNRALVIQDTEGNEVISASYLGEDNDNTGADIHYTYPKSGTVMVKDRSLVEPTPGELYDGQVPLEPVQLPDVVEDVEAPVIDHTPVTEANAFSAVTIEATITDNLAIPLATLYYKEEEAENYIAVPMHPGVEDPTTYTAQIPSKDVQKDVVYYIEATDGTNTDRTVDYTIQVEDVDIDFQTIPKFLVTEIVPDTANIDGADGYEFIEIYNNTDKAINFKDYKLTYRYDRDPSRDVVWASVPEEVIIPSGETLVFWIINASNGAATVADFNVHYGTSLVENEDIVRIYSAGMANGSMRGVVVKTNVGKEIAVSYYNEQPTVDDTTPDKGIFYKYPVDGSIESIKASAGVEDATPGTVEDYQVPAQPVQIIEDTVAPTINNMTMMTEVHEKNNILVRADVQDDEEVISVRLFYKTDRQEDYQSVVLRANAADGLYHHTIFSPELIGNETVEYYFVATDGFTEVTSETFGISIMNDREEASLRLNVEEKEILNGNVILRGTSEADLAASVKLFINETKVEDVYNSLENVSYFAIDVTGLNTYFKNAVTIGDDVLLMMDQDWLTDWKTFSIPIDPDLLQVGENTITVRSGNKASPWDLDSPENRDDYDIKNIRLVLADGTILRDPNFTDPTRMIRMSDTNPFEHFNFTITEEHAKAKTYNWDTTTVVDGEHTITVQDRDEEITRTVLVDNTAPIVEPTVEEGKEYKGVFTIDAEVTDEIAGVESVQVFLDDEEIAVPYETASSKLAPGEHKLTVVAVDTVGNREEVIVHFSVVNENPDKPELESPEDGIVEGDPRLKVRVSDPTGDAVDVGFYQGYHYDSSMTESVQAYKNATDTEPPQMMIPDGEEAFTADDIEKTKELDGDYLVTDSDTQFPYHRFDVTVDDAVDENDIVELVWQGNSLEGRKVSMYAWSHEENDWVLLDYKIAGTEDFELKANVQVGEFVHENNVNVLVQDEIPSSPDEYDYTFVWMSDTQYYAESYPHIFESQTKWIADMAEEMKIKYVFHTGDLVDEADKEYQWQYADQYMGILDEHEIPYGVLAGNHDVHGVNNDYTDYYRYFGANRFNNKPYYGGSYLNNRGHYDLISVGGNDFIMVYLGWDVTEEGIAWMNEVLAAHPDRMAILNFHEYLLASGTRHPLGEKLYQEIVVPNENVIAVLSGHYHEAQTYMDEIDDNGDGVADRTVYQMLADYQAGPEGGQGYMRLLHFDQDNNRIIVNTYSPYMEDYNYYDNDQFPGKDEFIIELDLTVMEKRVATDYFAVNVYTDNEIGTVTDVASGETAEVVWTGLEEGKMYSWYTVVSDQFTGETRSDLWTFVKGEDAENPPGEDPEDPENPGVKPGDESGEKPGDGGTNSVEPSNPDNGNDKDESSKDGNAKHPEHNNDQDKVNNSAGKNKENTKDGAELPNTSANMYNFIFIGIALLLIGVGVYVYYRRKRIA